MNSCTFMEERPTRITLFISKKSHWATTVSYPCQPMRNSPFTVTLGNLYGVFVFLLLTGFTGCSHQAKNTEKIQNDPRVKIAGAMHRVMMKGELSGIIDLDTIVNKDGLYGVGPIEYIKGEIMLWDGQSYYS